MQKKFILFLLIGFLISSCSPLNTVFGPFLTITADSFDDLRWEYTEDQQDMRPALLLECQDVIDCHDDGLYPDKYYVEGESEELYIWTREYFPGSYLFYVVVYRPYENTWDGLGFENIDSLWTVGIYRGYRKHEPDWYMYPVNSSSVVLGITGETWGVVVNAISYKTFEYKLVSNYWSR